MIVELYEALESPEDLIKVVRAFQGQAAYLQAAPIDKPAQEFHPSPVRPPSLQPKMIREGEVRRSKIMTYPETQPVKPTPPPLKMIQEGEVRRTYPPRPRDS
jgi:hypothetical protein